MKHHRIIALTLALILTVLAIMPASAAPKGIMNYCKGAEFTVADEISGLAENVSLHWSILLSEDGTGFSNQGQCIAYVNHGGTLYFNPCPLLNTDGKLYTARCFSRSWLLTTAGQ